jgi:hypothetical protein
VYFAFRWSVELWCVWFLVHFPGLRTPPIVAGLVLSGWFLLRAGWMGRGMPAGWAWRVGLGAGLASGVLNLLLLGSALVKQPETGTPAPGVTGLTSSFPIMVLGFLLLCGAAGAAAAMVGNRLGARSPSAARPAPDWLARFGVLTAASIVPLLLLGGLVTSADAGLSVRGWPDSFGANMFLYPLSLMTNPRVFLEHHHRLFGALVGFTTIALTLWGRSSTALGGRSCSRSRWPSRPA